VSREAPCGNKPNAAVKVGTRHYRSGVWQQRVHAQPGIHRNAAERVRVSRRRRLNPCGRKQQNRQAPTEYMASKRTRGSRRFLINEATTNNGTTNAVHSKPPATRKAPRYPAPSRQRFQHRAFFAKCPRAVRETKRLRVADPRCSGRVRRETRNAGERRLPRRQRSIVW